MSLVGAMVVDTPPDRVLPLHWKAMVLATSMDMAQSYAKVTGKSKEVPF